MAATREAGHEHIHTHGHDHTHAHDHGHDHTHDHDHVHPHDHEHAQDKWHAHTHDAAHPHTHGGVNDYMQAISAYRKTFPSRQQVLEQTPDPAVREMLLYMEQIGCDTAFDRFDKQQPQCAFGMAGVCCKNCNMGPCKITPKSPRGVCGADADLIVARNLLRSAAGGVAQHGAHAREVLLSLKFAAEGKLKLPRGRPCLWHHDARTEHEAARGKTRRRPPRRSLTRAPRGVPLHRRARARRASKGMEETRHPPHQRVQ